MSTEQRMRDGARPPRRGCSAARMGGVEQVKERVRDVRSGKWLEDSCSDIGYGRACCSATVRSLHGDALHRHRRRRERGDLQLRRRPAAAAASGPAAWASCTSSDVGCRAGARRIAERLVSRLSGLARTDDQLCRSGRPRRPVGASFAASPTDLPRIRMGEGVTANFFDVMGVGARPGSWILSRMKSRSRAATPSSCSVIEFWHEEFGADAGVLGRQVLLNGQSFTVVGVAPEDFSVSRYRAVGVLHPLVMEPVLLGNNSVLEARDYRRPEHQRPPQGRRCRRRRAPNWR